MKAARQGFASGFGEVLQKAQQKTKLDDELHRLYTSIPSAAGGKSELTREDRLGEVLARHGRAALLEGASRLFSGGVTENFLNSIAPQLQTSILLQHVVDRIGAPTKSHLKWRVERVDGTELLLGDCGPILRTSPRGRFVHMLSDEGDPSSYAIYLPIGPDRLLVGSHSLKIAVPNVATLNRATIELSSEFVTGLWPAARLRAVSKDIGMRAATNLDLALVEREARGVGTEIAEYADAVAIGVTALCIGKKGAATAGATPAATSRSAVAAAKSGVRGTADGVKLQKFGSAIIHSAVAAEMAKKLKSNVAVEKSGGGEDVDEPRLA